MRYEVRIEKVFIVFGVLVVIIMVSGCATFDYVWWKAWPESVKPWVYVTALDVPLACHTLGFDPDRTKGRINACAQWRHEGCLVVLPSDAPRWLIEHEERHCEGWVHD